MFGVVEEIRHKNSEFLYGALRVSDIPLLRQGVAALNVTPPDSGTSNGSGSCPLRGGASVSCFWLGLPSLKKAAVLSLKSISKRASRSSALIFLYSASWAAVISSPLVPEWVFLHLFTQHPHGLWDQTVGFCHLADRAGLLNALQHDLLFELFAVLSCGDNTDFTSHVRLNLFFVTSHETCSTPLSMRPVSS